MNFGDMPRVPARLGSWTSNRDGNLRGKSKFRCGDTTRIRPLIPVSHFEYERVNALSQLQNTSTVIGGFIVAIPLTGVQRLVHQDGD